MPAALSPEEKKPVPGKMQSKMTLQQLFEQLQTSEQGLTSVEAQQRYREIGPNEPVSHQRQSAILQFLRLFINPLVAILLIASLISIILGDRFSAAIIIAIVLVSNIFNFLQTYHSQNAIEQLRSSVTPTATILRDGVWTEKPRREIVPGDIIRLAAGDLIPADARLIEAVDLHVQQSALTGESLPVEKHAAAPQESLSDGIDNTQSVFLGTSVVSGTGKALVIATGRNTTFGDIAMRLASHAPETDFERGIRQFGLFITQTVFFLVLFIFLVGILAHHAAFETIFFAIALAVGLTPEFLPMITTVTLGRGAIRMARQKVIVKHLEAIQNFGSIDILCSDKTGTLTSGETKLEAFLDPQNRLSERVHLFAYLNSFYETGFKSPLDAAILSHSTPDIQGYSKVAELPFDFERRRLSVVVKHNNTSLLITKGAPESILAICTAYECDGACLPLGPIDSPERAQFTSFYQNLSQQGYRVLALAYRNISSHASSIRTDEQNLTLLGFLTFADPPKEGVADVLQALQRDGVQVKIVTGDNELVARHVCEQVGLKSERIVLGNEIESMTDTALSQIVEQTHIFARVSPAQKNRIILALKMRKHVVGYMGDGINDAPSLHAADVGISVASAVEVARDAAAIILLEPDLKVLHQGILEGRKAFGNVIKYLLMGTSSNFGNMFSMAGAYVFLPFLPMLPTQILLNNFLYDMAQITIPSDTVDENYIRKPQHWNISLIRNFMLSIGPISSLFDFLTFFIMLRIFHADDRLFHTGWFVESLATQTLVIFVIRTMGNPLRSRPSRALTVTTLSIVAFGIFLPFSPLAMTLGFVPLPALYFCFLIAMTLIYLCLVQIVKSLVMRKYK